MDYGSLAILIAGLVVFATISLFFIRRIRKQPQTSSWYKTRMWLPIVILVILISISSAAVYHYQSPATTATQYIAALTSSDISTAAPFICADSRTIFLDSISRTSYQTYPTTNISGQIAAESITNADVLITVQFVNNDAQTAHFITHLKPANGLGWCIVYHF